MIEKHVKNNSLNIIVRTNASKNKIIKWDSDKKSLRVNIKAPPEQGKANREIIKFFTKLLKKKIKITSGLKSRKKLLKIE